MFLKIYQANSFKKDSVLLLNNMLHICDYFQFHKNNLIMSS